MSYYAAFGRTVELLLNVFPGLGLGRYIHSEMEAKFKIGPGERFWKRRILSYIRDCSPRSSIEFLFLGASIQMHREQLASRSNAETNECLSLHILWWPRFLRNECKPFVVDEPRDLFDVGTEIYTLSVGENLDTVGAGGFLTRNSLATGRTLQENADGDHNCEYAKSLCRRTCHDSTIPRFRNQ